jgi:hypothetical protein
MEDKKNRSPIVNQIEILTRAIENIHRANKDGKFDNTEIELNKTILELLKEM